MACRVKSPILAPSLACHVQSPHVVGGARLDGRVVISGPSVYYSPFLSIKVWGEEV
jgi:hypothetical protein